MKLPWTLNLPSNCPPFRSRRLYVCVCVLQREWSKAMFEVQVSWISVCCAALCRFLKLKLTRVFIPHSCREKMGSLSLFFFFSCGSVSILCQIHCNIHCSNNTQRDLRDVLTQNHFYSIYNGRIEYLLVIEDLLFLFVLFSLSLLCENVSKMIIFYLNM